MAKRVLSYECEWCGEIKKTKHICVRHEKACLRNPDLRNCAACQHSRFIDGRNYKMRCAVDQKNCTKLRALTCENFRRDDEKTQYFRDKYKDLFM